MTEPQNGATSAIAEEAALDPDLPIIDPHHHLWWEPPFPIFPPFPLEELARTRKQSGHNVTASVYVDCMTGYLTEGPEQFRVIGETRTMEAEAQRAAQTGGDLTGLVSAIVSRADMMMGTGVQAVLEAHIQESPERFRGIRHMTPWLPGHNFYDQPISEHMACSPPFIKGVQTLGRLGLSFDSWVVFTQLSDIAKLAQAAPDTAIILDHAGTPMPLESMTPEEAFAIWSSGMAELAACPNVFIKIGGLLMYDSFGRQFTSEEAADQMRQHVLTTIDLFSPKRCMFESNFPVDGLKIPYGNLWNAFKRLTSDFSPEDKADLFSETARRVYRPNPA